MEPMKPMQPMAPIAPLPDSEAWWPAGLGQPSTSGAQDGIRYAVFPDRRRVLVEHGGQVTAYDSGDHRITGAAQGGDGAGAPSFASEAGPVSLAALAPVR